MLSCREDKLVSLKKKPGEVILNIFKYFIGLKSGSKEFQNSFLSCCHFALVLQLDKEGCSTCPAQMFTSKDEQTSRFFEF